MDATVKPAALPIKTYDAAHGILTIDAPNGWADVKPLTKLVLDYAGRDFVFTGWNSDYNVAYFKADAGRVALVKGRRG